MSPVAVPPGWSPAVTPGVVVVGGVPGFAVAAQPAFRPQDRQAVVDQVHPGLARRARLIGAPYGVRLHQASPPAAGTGAGMTAAAIARMSSSATNAARTRTGSGEPSRR